MARGGNNLLVLALLAGGVWLGLSGKLGEQVQLSLGQAISSLLPKDKGCANAIPNGLIEYCKATCNTNIGQQMLRWKAERLANFENPNDWSAFVKHIQAIGAPRITTDRPFSEFCENKGVTCTGVTPNPRNCLDAWPPLPLPSGGSLPWV